MQCVKWSFGTLCGDCGKLQAFKYLVAGVPWLLSLEIPLLQTICAHDCPQEPVLLTVPRHACRNTAVCAVQRTSVAAKYGGFEAHTTGFGSRMLAKWGFGGAGAGLGASQQGIAEPIAAVRRGKGVGLGAE